MGAFSSDDYWLKIYDEGDGLVRLCIFLSTNYGYVEGDVQGLNSDDTRLLRDVAPGEDLWQMLCGLAKTSPVTYAPDVFVIAITSCLRESLRLMNPIQTFNTFDDVEGNPLPFDPCDRIAYPPMLPSDESRAAIITALGGTVCHMKVLEENQRLKDDQFLLIKIKERVGMVEVSHSKGNIKLLLTNGESKKIEEEGSRWVVRIGEDDCANADVACADLRLLSCEVLGVRLLWDFVGIGVNAN